VRYRLEELALAASEAGFAPRRSDLNCLEIPIAQAVVLVFANLVDEADTLVGFDGTPWHSHGVVQFMTGSDSYVECDELELLAGLTSGDLLVVSLYRGDTLCDRWIAHRLDASDLRDIEAGDALHFLCLASGDQGTSV
jgi:hypothetical protein